MVDGLAGMQRGRPAGSDPLGYSGGTMAQARAGRTVEVSVSLANEDLATLRRYARAEHQGNLSVGPL